VNDGDEVGGGRGPCRFDEEDTLVLAAADAGAALIADDADCGDGGVTIFGGAFEDMVTRSRTGGTSGAGLTTMGGRGGNYADPARAILDDNSGHLLGPPWHIQHGNHSCSRCGDLQQWHHTIVSGKRFKMSLWDGAPAGVAIGHATADDGDGHSPLLPSSTTASPPPQRQQWRWIAMATLRVD